MQDRTPGSVTSSDTPPSGHTSTSTSLLSQLQAPQNKPPYPRKPNRYFRFGLNANYQDCYTKAELGLLSKISQLYTRLFAQTDRDTQPPFTTNIEKAWWDFWSCERPVLLTESQKTMQPTIFEVSDFTLPSRPSQDAQTFPLWDYADRMAKQIANWQAQRVSNQDPKLMNDPTMLAMQELRDWIYHHLANVKGTKEDLTLINKRQSYVKNLMHLVPVFGRDRLRLQQIHDSLEHARGLIQNAIAKRELPNLLAEMINNAKTFEGTIGAYLHYLFTDEKVDDNYSMGCLDNPRTLCEASPVKTIFTKAKALAAADHSQGALVRFKNQYPLVNLNEMESSDNQLFVMPTPRIDVADDISFASFVTEKDKFIYVEAHAILQALIQARETMENFRKLQTSLGSYFFAHNFMETTKELGNNYIAMVEKANRLLSELINKSNAGQRRALHHPDTNRDKHFLENMRKLETLVIRDGTLNDNLQSVRKQVTASTANFNSKMNELVTDWQSGKASDEIRHEMAKLFMQITDLNQMLTAMTDHKQITIDLADTRECIEAPFSDACLKQTEQLLIDDGNDHEHFEDIDAEPIEDENPSLSIPPQGRIIAAARSGALQGTMRGAASVVNTTMQHRGWSETTAYYTTQAAYYGMFFTTRLCANYDQRYQDPTIATYEAAQQAAIETGQMWLTTTALNTVASGLNTVGNVLEKLPCTYLVGKGVKALGSLSRYGVFAYTAATSNPLELGASIAAGAVAENLTEQLGSRVLS